MDATDTSNGSTKTEQLDLSSVRRKQLGKRRKKHCGNGTTSGCRSSRVGFRWRPWVSVVPLVGELRRRFGGVGLNRVLNEGFLLWWGVRCEGELALRARLARLLQEERELMQLGRVILRSGAFLDSYAAKLIKGDERLSVKLGRKPLRALAGEREVNIVLRLLARRDAVVKEILEIQDKLLPKDEYVLKGDFDGGSEGDSEEEA